ncbi:MAG: hypothetical protein KTR18_11300 [Acidiferrobacterales bacterium]|nr:hypothetical protein [Acidiferrobacterales bacterium]
MSQFFISLDAPFDWILTNQKSEVVDHGSVDELDLVRIPKSVREVIGIAPGQSVTVRAVMVPGKRLKNVEAALPYALEEGLTEDVDDLHFTLLRWKPDEEAIAAIVSRAQMDQWISRFTAVNITLDRIVPGYLLLPLYNESSCTISQLPDQSVYVRKGELNGFSMDQSFFEYWLDSDQIDRVGLSFTDLEQAQRAGQLLKNAGKSEIEIRHWDIGNRLVDWLRLDKEQRAISEITLLHGVYTPKHLNRSYRPLKVATVCLLIALSLLTLSMWRETSEMQQRESAVNEQITTLFKRRFPGEPYLGRPRVQITSLLSSGESTTSRSEFQRLLQSVSKVAQANRATIEEVNFRDQAMTVLCNVDSLAVLDNIRSALQGIPGINAELLSSGARDNQVSGRFRLSGAG